MTRASLLPLALFGCLAGSWVNSAAQSKTPVEYRITGTLVSSADGSPIAHGHLVPTLVDRESSARRRFPAPGAAFDTDEHGRFSFTTVRPRPVPFDRNEAGAIGNRAGLVYDNWGQLGRPYP